MNNMARDYIRTVTDLERYYYGAGNAMGYSYSGSELLKADAPLMSSTAGTYQAIYGRKVWSQLNQEFNAFSILPKRPWERSGWRVITARPSFTVGGGVAGRVVRVDQHEDRAAMPGGLQGTDLRSCVNQSRGVVGGEYFCHRDS